MTRSLVRTVALGLALGLVLALTPGLTGLGGLGPGESRGVVGFEDRRGDVK